MTPTAKTDEERAKTVVWTMRSSDHQCTDSHCGACVDFVLAALRAVREEAAKAIEDHAHEEALGLGEYGVRRLNELAAAIRGGSS